jgi:mannose-6-phosphate isomerase-like protein (cupin superfamily)
MFGHAPPVQSETTPFEPCSPYAISKLFAYWTTVNYRESYGIHASNGILFNHESPRRGETFVTRKVTRSLARILAGKERYLYLGNLEALRDWGYAPEYVEWIWRILQHETPDDFVIATGETHSVEEFVAAAFARAGMPNWQDYVDYDRDLTRPAEVDLLCGDASKSKAVLGFEPKVKFAELVAIMVDAEMAKFRTRHSDDRRDLETFPEAKVLTFKQDAVVGGHWHERKDELFILSEGEGRMVLDRADGVSSSTWMEVGKIYTVPAGTPHWFHMKAGSKLVGLNTRAYDPADDHHVAAKASAA